MEKGKIIYGALAPHAPIIVPAVGGGRAAEVADTAAALRQVGKDLAEIAPEVVIVVSPHGPAFSDSFPVVDLPEYSGDLRDFGAGKIRVSMSANRELAAAIGDAMESSGLPSVVLDGEGLRRWGADEGGQLDYASVVPLWFLVEEGLRADLVYLGLGILRHNQVYEAGKAVAQAVEKLGVTAAFIASGDMSHRLTPDAPAGYDPQGKDFDQAVRDAISSNETDRILALDEKLVSKAGECGLRPLIMLLGAMGQGRFSSKVLSYEGPFGVGYLVASFRASADADNDEHRHPLVELAHSTILQSLEDGDVSPEGEVGDESLVPMAKTRAGVFVTLKNGGQLRGCIGTIGPTQANLVEEVRENALSAAFRDPRFMPVSLEEARELSISVDVLSKPEPVDGPDDLDPERYGVVVEKGTRQRGLLLPGLEGVDTVEEQLTIAKQKAGISPADDDVSIYRFTVTRYH